MPKYEGILMKNGDVVINRVPFADWSNADRLGEEANQYLGIIETDDYEIAEREFNIKARL